MSFAPFCCSLLTAHRSLLFDDPVRSQHIWWNRQIDLFGGFEIDDEFKLRRLLHGGRSNVLHSFSLIENRH